MSGKKKKARAIDRPFEADVLRRAREIVEHYGILIWFEDGEWYGHGLEMPHVYGDGATPAKCVEATREALVSNAAYMLEEGQQPPAPAREGARTEQVNVRLSAEEKLMFEAGAQRRGFKGLSDFIRAAAVEYAR